MLEPDGEYLLPSFGAPAKVVARYHCLCEQWGLLVFPNPYIEADRGIANAPLFIDFPPIQVRARDEIALRAYVKRLVEKFPIETFPRGVDLDDAPEVTERQMRRLFTHVRVTSSGIKLEGRARVDWQVIIPACLRVWNARHPASSEPLPLRAVARKEGITVRTARRRYRLACAVIGMPFSEAPPSDEEIRAHIAHCAICTGGTLCRWHDGWLPQANPHPLKGLRHGIEAIADPHHLSDQESDPADQ